MQLWIGGFLTGLGLGALGHFLFGFAAGLARERRARRTAPKEFELHHVRVWTRVADNVAISELTQGDVRITFDPPIAVYPGEDVSEIVAARINAPTSGDVRHHRR